MFFFLVLMWHYMGCLWLFISMLEVRGLELGIGLANPHPITLTITLTHTLPLHTSTTTD